MGVRYHVPKISTPPFNFIIASKLPVKVTQPTKAESPIAIHATLSSNQPKSLHSPLSINLKTSEAATRALAAPPKPLKRATISGIPVICTLTAITYPIKAPNPSPAPIINSVSVAPKSI